MSKIRVGVGFATGRKCFQQVLKSYILNFQESGLLNNNVELNIYIAYDLAYKGAQISDYTSIPKEIGALTHQIRFLGAAETAAAKEELIHDDIADLSSAGLLFGSGYAAQRNLILFYAIQDSVDYLLFLDDDEYPLAVTCNGHAAIWSGQHVLKMHLQNIRDADITYGYHCGYLSPVPTVNFSNEEEKNISKSLIEALSNDVVNWDSFQEVMQNGGVTYADTNVLIENRLFDVPEKNHAKFISGSNLCINLTDPRRVFPFYNPPGARGEDTFLSTCLSDRRVLRVPCYTFHDGFSIYSYLLSGVLPMQLSMVDSTQEQNVQRFLSACVGWARYKPLYLYITQPESYREKIDEAKRKLTSALPYVCDYFHSEAFKDLQHEMEDYDSKVSSHYSDFLRTKKLWAKLMNRICTPSKSVVISGIDINSIKEQTVKSHGKG
jgi:hypothetical protein